ncbi:MAG: hypothetical protein ABI132_02560 [Rhodanobacteraceae bacterium]
MNARHRSMKSLIRGCIAITIALSCCTNPAFAQTSEEPTATVKVSPDRIEPGGSVTISGLGYMQGSLKLILTVTRPDGVKTTLGAVPDNQGRYSTPYIGAPKPGDYTVSAQVSEKGAPAIAHFKVESNAIDIDEGVADNKKFLEQGTELVKTVKAKVDNTPDSPAKTEMEAKLGNLETKLQQVSQQSAQLPAMLAPFKSLLAEHPETQAALQPMLDHLDQLDQKTRQQSDAVVKTAADLQKTLAACDSIDHAVQALRGVSDVLDLLREPYEFVTAYTADMAKSQMPAEAGPAEDAARKAVNLAHGIQGAGSGSNEEVEEAMGAAKGAIAENGIELGSETAIAEKLVEAIPESIRKSDGYKFAVTEVKKFAPRVINDAANPMKLLNDDAALTTDVASYGEKKMFARYCEKFEGPFTAKMAAYFYAKGYDQDWWHFTIAIKGKLTLLYPKDAGGASVPLSGQFEGGATRFGYNESVWKHSDLIKIAGGAKGLVGTKDTAPMATDPGKGGVLSSLLSPTSFYIPVSGHYANGRVDFKLESASTDFDMNYVRGRTFYAVISPYTLYLPVMSAFSLPYMDAHFLLGHFGFKYPVVQSKDSMVVDAHEDRDADRPPGNKAHYTFTLKACNPSCGSSKE